MKLERLGLSCNELAGDIPQALGAIPTLAEVYLYGNRLDLDNVPANLVIEGRTVVLRGRCLGDPRPPDDDSSDDRPSTQPDSSDDDDQPRPRPVCPPPIPPLLPRLGQTRAATAYALPHDQLLLHTHDRAADAVVLDVGWLATDGASGVATGFVRDAVLGQTYAVVRRAADGRIVRRWIAPADPLVYAVPWDLVNSRYTLPVGVLAAIPLDEQQPQPHQLARRVDGGDDRIFAYDAEHGQTYAVVQREADGRIVRQWVPPDDPLVYAVPWELVNSRYTFPAAVLAALPLDDQYPRPNQLARRFDGGMSRLWPTMRSGASGGPCRT